MHDLAREEARAAKAPAKKTAAKAAPEAGGVAEPETAYAANDPVKPVRAAELLAAVKDVYAGGAPMTSNIARKVGRLVEWPGTFWGRRYTAHALLDDASRFIVAIEAHHSERQVDMLGLLVRALRRHGAPDALYLDNGSTYRGETLRIACERLGVTLLHARPYDAPARGKMERFWRTLREGCLDFLGAVTSLDDVQVKLRAFVEAHYHRAPHGSLMGRAPGMVFAEGMQARPDEITEERLRLALTTHDKRRVRNDTTISIDGTHWELDQGFLAGRVVVVGRNLVNPDDPPWVEYEGKRLVLHPVDATGNARRKRPPKQAAPAAPTAPVRFDPVGALRTEDAPDSNDEEIF